MGLFRVRFNVQRRSSNGYAKESVEPREALKEIMLNDWKAFKEDYENLTDELKDSFYDALLDLAKPFAFSVAAIEIHLELLDEEKIKEVYASINKWQEEHDPAPKAAREAERKTSSSGYRESSSSGYREPERKSNTSGYREPERKSNTSGYREPDRKVSSYSSQAKTST